MSAMWSIKRGRIVTASLGVLSAWACTVANKSDYTFTDTPEGSGGKGAAAGKGSSTAGKAGTSGEAGMMETSGTGGTLGRGGRGAGGRGTLLGGRGGNAGEAGESGAAGEAGASGKGGTAGESGAGGEAGATPVNKCGDGNLDAGEQCDLGANNGVTACPYGQMSCTVCTTACKRAAGTTAYCGDGKVQASHEQCDDGNTIIETCAYGDAACTGCDNSCKSLAVYCGDKVVNGSRLTSIKLDYVGLWGGCPSTALPFYLNGVPIANVAPSSICNCGTTTIQTLTITDANVLAAVKPNDNVFEVYGLTTSTYAYTTWVRMTFSFEQGPDIVSVVYDPNQEVGNPYLCTDPAKTSVSVDTLGYVQSAPFGGLPIEQCDGSSNCTGCETPLPKTCADVLHANAAAPDGLYRIDPTGGLADDAITAFCDMTDGAVSYEALGFGDWNTSYDGYTMVTDTDLQNPLVLQALLWLYNVQGGMFNLEPGWVSTDCAFRTSDSYIKVNTNVPVVPADHAQTVNQWHCNLYDQGGNNIGNYTDALMKFAMFSPTNQTETPPVILNFFTSNPITLVATQGSTYPGPAFFFKKQ
ncbi:MAG TPA: fibrinogen-like YCDxxxxGGGW domain-containing protein [Polyangiaceae bacterium]|nr:fibrinogen-like YCDxxxxGGGW domain-containing protein [Polyangiaceae bacterium]